MENIDSTQTNQFFILLIGILDSFLYSLMRFLILNITFDFKITNPVE